MHLPGVRCGRRNHGSQQPGVLFGRRPVIRRLQQSRQSVGHLEARPRLPALGDAQQGQRRTPRCAAAASQILNSNSNSYLEVSALPSGTLLAPLPRAEGSVNDGSDSLLERDMFAWIRQDRSLAFPLHAIHTLHPCQSEKVNHVLLSSNLKCDSGVQSQQRRLSEANIYAAGIVSCLDFNPDRSGMMAAGSYSGQAAMYDSRTGELLYLLQGQKGGITQVQPSPVCNQS